jgi:phospholipid/cholesterol/gamma-HCH transport system substrate-binding protein
VTRQGKAHIVMDIDNSVWPLPTDSTLTLRMGGTIKYTDRFIAIARGHGKQVFGNGGYVPANQFIVPVEYDQLFNTFTGPVRAGMDSFLDNGGEALKAAAPALGRALGDSAPALGQTAAVFRDLAYDQQALTTLVDSTDDVAGAVATSNPGVQRLLQGAANTFTAVASESRALQGALAEAPPALQALGHVADHVSRTLVRVSALADRLAPGVTQLQAVATPLDRALGSVVDVEPDAIQTLDTVRRAGPSLDALLSKGRATLMPRLQSIGKQAARDLACVRPYSPEIFGFLTTWAGYWGDGDDKDTVIHGAFGVTDTTNTNTIDSAQLGKLVHLNIDYPGVPGMALNQPWYQPACGITANDLKLADDGDAGTFDPLGGKLVPYPSGS